MNTLEARLQAVARRMVARPTGAGENGAAAQARAQAGALRGVLMPQGGASPTMSGMPVGPPGSHNSVKLENGMPPLQGAGSMLGGGGVALPSPHQVGGLVGGQMMPQMVPPAHVGMQQGMKQDPSGLPMRPQSTGPLMGNPMAGPNSSGLMGSSSQGGTPTMVSRQPRAPVLSPFLLCFWIHTLAGKCGYFGATYGAAHIFAGRG